MRQFAGKCTDIVPLELSVADAVDFSFETLKPEETCTLEICGVLAFIDAFSRLLSLLTGATAWAQDKTDRSRSPTYGLLNQNNVS